VDLEEQRHLAYQRATKKKQEDERAAMQRAEEREMEKQRLKEVMKEKAERLAEVTQQRVAKLYVREPRRLRKSLGCAVLLPALKGRCCKLLRLSIFL